MTTHEVGDSASAFAASAAHLADGFRKSRPLRSGSLIVTLYGDAIVPRGGTVWLGSIARLLEPFGISDRLVRTSVFRLARDGWLESEQVGRRSYYRPTQDGRRRFDRAALRIYTPPLSSGTDDWTLVVLPPGDTALRERLRKALAWLGFGRLDASVLAHPSADPVALADALDETGASGAAVTLTATPADAGSGDALRQLAATAWDLADLAGRYRAFVRRYQPILDDLEGDESLTPADCFTVRLLMIHDYRKIVLRDPRLPADALPDDWAGLAAYRVCRRLYAALLAGSERCLTDMAETVDGPLPTGDTSLRARFPDAIG